MSGEPALIQYPAADDLESIGKEGEVVSECEYWETYYFESDIQYEWNDGHLEAKPVSDYATFQVYEWFKGLVQHFLRVHRIGCLVGLEMGFRMALPTKTVIRKPDLGIVRDSNPQPLLPFDCSYHGIFDICIEALSDKTKRGRDRDLVYKKADYAAGGVSEYYVLHREPENQRFFTLSPQGVYVPIQPIGGVLYSQVLPGFGVRLSDLTTLPEPETMRDDPVYPFVLPGWRESDRRADAEAQRADAEAQRADAAERELAALKARYGEG